MIIRRKAGISCIYLFCRDTTLPSFFATVGLGLGDFVYRIIAFLVSVVPGKAWVRCTGMAMAKEKREIVYHEECINTAFCAAIAL